MTFESRYSFFDRTLHRLAFMSATAQIGLADVEDKMFRDEIAQADASRPVFITGLPRAGTTLLLEICVATGGFAAHRYRDMPFVLCPMLWARYASGFRKEDELRERAHGDGMMINADSVEAFDEMVWKAFWREHYGADRIEPWTNEQDDEFFEFLRNHMRKIIALNSRDGGPPKRYVSKNNLNIARTALLRRSFPDAALIVPFREPLSHARSLLRQHLNFLDMHAEDKFARDYMAGVGHFDFGANLKPVNFGGWLDAAGCKDATSLAFWLEYWIAAYGALAARDADSLAFFCFEDMRRAPEAQLARLALLVGADDPRRFTTEAPRVKPLSEPRADDGDVDPARLSTARAVYESLRGKSAL